MDWLLNLAGCKDEMVLRLTPGHGKVPRLGYASNSCSSTIIRYYLYNIGDEVHLYNNKIVNYS